MRGLTVPLASACIVLVACRLVGCGAQNETAPTAHPAARTPDHDGGGIADGDDDDGGAEPARGSSEEKEIESIKAFFAAQNAHDDDAVAELYEKDARVTTPATPDWVGIDMIREGQKDLFDSVSDGKFGARRILAKGNVVIAEWTATGTVPAEIRKTGRARRFGVSGVSVFWFAASGLLKEEHDLMNASTLNAQAGTGKTKVREVLLQPSGTPDVRIASGTPEEAKNVDVAKAIDRAYEMRDEKGFSDLLTDDIVWDDFTAPAPLTGRADVSHAFAMLVAALPDMKLVCKAWGIDDVVAQECSRHATHEGLLPLGSLKVPASHAETTTHFVDVALIKRGKIAKLSRYADNFEMAEQIGLTKPSDDKAPAPSNKHK